MRASRQPASETASSASSPATSGAKVERPVDPFSVAGGAAGSSPALDLSPLLAGFDFTPGEVNVRKIIGVDGKARYQLRLDLGLLQMELSGRPDGRRPHGCASLLDYHQERLLAHRSTFGHDRGFLLSPDDCRELRDEAGMYYHRYLCAFVLGEHAAVVRDARRNLGAIEFCRLWAAEPDDRAAMEAYLPYVVMMQARASAMLCLQAGRFDMGARVVASALRRIKRHYRRHGGQAAYAASREVRVLKKVARQLRKATPVTPARRLARLLARAVREENYERAAQLRDELARL